MKAGQTGANAMTEQVASSIEIPSAISPADADAFKIQALSTLEAAKETSSGVALGVEGQSLTPVAIQLLIAAMRTADRFGVALDVSEQCQGVLTDMQLN